MLLVVGLPLRQLCRCLAPLGLLVVASCVSAGKEVVGRSMEAVAIRSVADMPSPFVTVVPVEQQVSPDGRWAAVVSPVSPWEQRVQLVDVATGAVLAADVASVAACYWLPAAD